MTSWVDEATLINRRFYEQGAAAYANRWADRSFALHLYERFVSLIGHGCLVLDLGCGPAHDSAELAARGLRPVACAIARAMLYEARSHDAVRGLLVQCNLRVLPFETALFDGVWASASLLHIKKQDVSIALSEVCRVLKSGGIFYNSMQEGEHDGLVPATPDEPIPGFRYYKLLPHRGVASLGRGRRV